MIITFPVLPGSYDEFVAMAQDMMKKPEGTAALLLAALKLYVGDRETGLEVLDFLHGPRPLSVRDRQFIRDRMMDKVRLNSSGADSPRLVTLRRKASGDTWYLWDYPAIVTGIRLPAEEDPWA